MSIQTKDIETQILKEIQEGLPIQINPFETLAQKLSISQQELLDILKEQKEKKIIRQISPIYDTKSLGYQSSLVAFSTPKENLLDTANIINQHPGVSHNYERNHHFNLWFTIAVPPDSKIGLEKTVQILAQKAKIDKYVILKTVKFFKIGVKLNVQGTDLSKEKYKEKKTATRPLTEEEKHIIKETQFDLPLKENPFEDLAKNLNISEQRLIDKLQQLKEEGFMRRFAGILNHRKAGFKANGMVVWEVPEEKVEQIGKILASYKAVTHCYLRTTNQYWKYNLFSMVHGKTKEEVYTVVDDMVKETGISNYHILFSTKEFKKVRLKYFIEDYYQWEQEHV
ncbi:MAG: Lrp/AsnC family transcriptional regulator [Aquificae bacterium]|nr:Lrp/AsnC family transcriptional regulator [Aquificota bacterium]